MPLNAGHRTRTRARESSSAWSASRERSRVFTPKPMAPWYAEARAACTHGTQFGSQSAMMSPSPTPSRSHPSTRRDTDSLSWAKV